MQTMMIINLRIYYINLQINQINIKKSKRIMQNLEKLTQYLELNKLDSLPSLAIIQEKTTLKPSIVLLLLIIPFLLISFFIIDLSPLVIGISCVIIPGYYTFETIGTKIQRQYIKYLVYWIMFGITEVLFEPILSLLFQNTFIMIFQVIMTVALLHPKFNMSLILYDTVIRKYIQKKEHQSQEKKQQTKKDQEQAKFEEPKINQDLNQTRDGPVDVQAQKKLL